MSKTAISGAIATAHKEAPSGIKQPKIALDSQDYYQKKPAWRVSRMEFSDPFGWQVIVL